MKMWPPPAGPKDRDPEKDVAHGGSSQSPLQPASSSSSRPTDQPVLQRVLSYPVQPKPAAVTSNAPPPPGYIQETNSYCHCSYWFKVTVNHVSCKQNIEFEAALINSFVFTAELILLVIRPTNSRQLFSMSINQLYAKSI